MRRSRVEAENYTFDRFADEFRDGLAEVGAGDEWPGDQALLLEEVKVGCMHGLLTCLDRPHRLAYILGDILEMDGVEAASILRISPAAFRKRLSRAREAVIEFTRAHCGLVDPTNACRCRHRLPRAQAMKRVDADALLFASEDSALAFPATLDKSDASRLCVEPPLCIAAHRNRCQGRNCWNEFARRWRDVLQPHSV